MSDLEIFTSLIAAIIHDFDHTGTTNNFHINSGSGLALLYNDRAVLENHHVSAFFRYVMWQNSLAFKLGIKFHEFSSMHSKFDFYYFLSGWCKNMIAIFSTTCRRLISVSLETWSLRWFFIRTWVNILHNSRLWKISCNNKTNTGWYKHFSKNK